MALRGGSIITGNFDDPAVQGLQHIPVMSKGLTAYCSKKVSRFNCVSSSSQLSVSSSMPLSNRGDFLSWGLASWSGKLVWYMFLCYEYNYKVNLLMNLGKVVYLLRWFMSSISLCSPFCPAACLTPSLTDPPRSVSPALHMILVNNLQF